MKERTDQTSDGAEHEAAKRSILYRILRSIVSLRGSPEAIALGTAIGVFVAFTPTIGFQMLIGAFIATLVGASRTAAVIPPWITNPVTIPPIFAGTYWLGSLLWPGPSASEVYHRLIQTLRGMDRFSWYEIIEQFKAFVSIGADLFVPMLIGGVIVGAVASVVTYPVVLKAVRGYRRRLGKLREKRAARKATKTDGRD